MVSTKASDCHTIGGFYGVSGKKLQRQYKDYLSDFKEWDQKPHAKQWLIFPQNISSRLSIDETALSKGELYTIITNKKAKGKKGSIVAIFSGTDTNEEFVDTERDIMEFREYQDGNYFYSSQYEITLETIITEGEAMQEKKVAASEFF